MSYRSANLGGHGRRRPWEEWSIWLESSVNQEVGNGVWECRQLVMKGWRDGLQLVLFLFYLFFETASHYVALPGLQLAV